RDRRAAGVRLHIVGEGAREAGADQVGGMQQLGAAGCVVRIGRVVHAVDIALGEHRRALVTGPTTADRIARAVAEGAYAGTLQRKLRSLHEARTIGDLAEVPALTDQVDVAAGGLVDALLQ